jgi:hypothetical protein
MQLLRVPSPVGPPQARLLAIMHVAMHDAINTITGEYETYGPAMNAPFGASPVAAGAAAAHLVLTTLVPANMIPNPNFDTALDSSLADIPEPERTLGINVGREAARHILALRKDDGFTTVVPYTPGSGPGVWVPTPPAFAPALLPGFGKVLPFALHQNDQFRPDGPPSLTSEEYAADVNEVQQLGDANGETLGHRTHAQSATARFWLGNSIPIFQQLARKMSIDRGLDLSANARFFALLSIAGMHGTRSSRTTSGGRSRRSDRPTVTAIPRQSAIPHGFRSPRRRRFLIMSLATPPTRARSSKCSSGCSETTRLPTP